MRSLAASSKHAMLTPSPDTVLVSLPTPASLQHSSISLLDVLVSSLPAAPAGSSVSTDGQQPSTLVEVTLRRVGDVDVPFPEPLLVTCEQGMTSERVKRVSSVLDGVTVVKRVLREASSSIHSMTTLVGFKKPGLPSVKVASCCRPRTSFLHPLIVLRHGWVRA